jgi:hypothetical protein
MASRFSRGHIEIFKLAGLALSTGVLGTTFVVAPQVRKATPKPAVRKPVSATDGFKKELEPFLVKYCAGCHGGSANSGNFNFAKTKTLLQAQSAAELWMRVSANVSGNQMPPKGMPAPTVAERQKFVDSIKTLIIANCGVSSPGRVTLRRLNRAEYNNTIRDLVEIDFRPADDFPSDDVGYGFDNIGDVLSLSPLLMEKYLDAAEQIAQRAVVVEKRGPIVVPGPNMTGTPGVLIDDDSADIYTFGTATAVLDIPRPGQFSIVISGYQYRAGNENARIQVKLDGMPEAEFELAATAPTVGSYSFSRKLSKGKHRVEITFLNDFYDPKLPAGKQDRNVTIKSVAARPLYVIPYPVSHRKLIPEDPVQGNERATAEKSLSKFAFRAYRRPVSSEEVAGLMKVYDLVIKAGEPFERGVQVAMQAVLVSPHFLFKVETEPPKGKADRDLTGYELATRLSYFLWSSTPDEALLLAASEGKLRTPDGIRTEVLRMLADPKATGLADNFAEQWLQLRRLENFQPSPEQFPGVDASLRKMMAEETKRFFLHVLKENLPVTDFLNGKYSFLNERLAKHYGIQNVSGNELRLVSLAGSNRGGVLSQASVLSITSNPTRTSPVKRGKWVLENILGTPPPPPPPNVGDLGDDGEILTSANLRERMEQHRKKPDCFSCHSRMDPIGFGLENYDAVGRWRTKDQGFSIDSSGELPDGRKFNGPDELTKILLQNKDQFARTLADRLMTYATGRGMEPKDQCHLDEVVAKSKAANLRFTSMIIAIAQSEPFRRRSVK